MRSFCEARVSQLESEGREEMKRTVPPLLVLRLQTAGALADAKTPGTRLVDMKDVIVLLPLMEC